MKRHILIVLCIILFIGTIIFFLKDSSKKQDSHNTFNPITAEMPIKKIHADTLKKINEKKYEYILPEDNYFRLNLDTTDINSFLYFLFDDNKLKPNIIDNNRSTISLISEYEITPGKKILEIFYSNLYPKEIYEIDVIYLLDFIKKINISNIYKSWIYVNQNCTTHFIQDDGIILGGDCKNENTIMMYEKNFDKDIVFEMDFKPIENKTTDIQLSFGERIYINFDNRQIRIKRKESIDNTVGKRTVIVEEKKYDRFKKDNLYKLKFSRIENTYSIFIDNIKIIEYIDDNTNPLPIERYKNLRIGIGKDNMKILIQRIEIR